MNKGLLAIIMIPLMLCRPLAVNAGVPETKAVEAMRKVWQIEEGQLTNEASMEQLQMAADLIRQVENKAVKRDLYIMRYAVERELKAKEEKEKQEAEEAQRAAERKAAASFYGICTITHYCGCSQCCGSWGNATASGAVPQTNHTVANDSLPFGTRVLINGQEYVVQDRGVSGDWFDIYCGSHEEALSRGMYQAEVYVIE